jgi:SAM-dependent methyltransferase
MTKEATLRAILEPGAAPPEGWQHYLPPSGWDPRRILLGRPRAYALVHDLITPTIDVHAWRRELPDPSTHVVVNLGCGYRPLHPDMINVDLVSAPHVDIPADLSRPLPIRSGSCDAVLSIAVVEHLRDPAFLVAEAARILKPGGLCYLAAPFFYPFHAAPADFTRWTQPGLEGLLGPAFERVSSGPRGGGAGVFILLASHLAGQLLCFGSLRVYGAVNTLVMALLSPLKLLDLALNRLPFADRLCPNFWVTGRKR